AEPELVVEDEVVEPEPVAAIVEPETDAVEAQVESGVAADAEPVAAVADVAGEAEAEAAADNEAEAEPAEAADDERPIVDLLAERGLAPEPQITPRTGLRSPGAAPTTPDERAAAAAAQTSALLAKFRPGQSLDEALAAYEEELARARAEEDVAQAVASTPSTAPGEPPAAPQAPEAVDAPAPTPEAPAAATAPARDDIELPSWPTAPAPTPALADQPAVRPHPVEPPAAPPPARPAQPARPAPPAAQPPAAPAAPASPWSLTPPAEAEGAPQWPAAPQWPTVPQWPATGPVARSDRAPVVPQLAGRPLVPDRSVEALWAASSSEVLARPAGPAPSVQPCVNCGLSLSANARFCRRCGTRQG
ncbi:MAG TPA: zinc ribbon domain-containing protein, partial [Candidatus Limnocylindrales bacterium]|nr:zinc ribbon domain-containing protein [Candidatus Limnocylindrales bacterium]